MNFVSTEKKKICWLGPLSVVADLCQLFFSIQADFAYRLYTLPHTFLSSSSLYLHTQHQKKKKNTCIYKEYISYYAAIIYLFFNLVFETGTLPETWLEGISKPIYKKKGDPLQPENYRPITILSCFGKLFTAGLDLRLNKFQNDHDILEENQAGFKFRAGYSTCDHVFSLHALIEILKSKTQKLFCSFIGHLILFGEWDCGQSYWRIISMKSSFVLYLICIRELNPVYHSMGVSQVSSLAYVGCGKGKIYHLSYLLYF